MGNDPVVEERELEKQLTQWAAKQATTRVFAISTMRHFLRCAGDDTAKAEKWLPTLDGLTSNALSAAIELMRLADREVHHG
jgi:hypothetical protein